MKQLDDKTYEYDAADKGYYVLIVKNEKGEWVSALYIYGVCINTLRGRATPEAALVLAEARLRELYDDVKKAVGDK